MMVDEVWGRGTWWLMRFGAGVHGGTTVPTGQKSFPTFRVV